MTSLISAIHNSQGDNNFSNNLYTILTQIVNNRLSLMLEEDLNKQTQMVT